MITRSPYFPSGWLEAFLMREVKMTTSLLLLWGEGRFPTMILLQFILYSVHSTHAFTGTLFPHTFGQVCAFFLVLCWVHLFFPPMTNQYLDRDAFHVGDEPADWTACYISSVIVLNGAHSLIKFLAMWAFLNVIKLTLIQSNHCDQHWFDSAHTQRIVFENINTMRRLKL